MTKVGLVGYILALLTIPQIQISFEISMVWTPGGASWSRFRSHLINARTPRRWQGGLACRIEESGTNLILQEVSQTVGRTCPRIIGAESLSCSTTRGPLQ